MGGVPYDLADRVPGSDVSGPTLTIGVSSAVTMRHRWLCGLAAGLLPAILAACGGGSTSGTAIWLIPRRAPDVRVTLSGGCPPNVAFNGDIRNDQVGLDDHLLQENPLRGLVCRYSATAGGPALYRMTSLDETSARQLAEVILRVSTAAPHGATSCPAAFPTATILVFSYLRHSDVDLWYNDTGCQTLDNGRVGAFQGGNPAFYGPFESLIDRLSPPRQP